MKKLILILVLFPCVSFSQILLEKVKTVCYSDYSRNIFECTDDLSEKKIFVEKNVLCIKSNYGIEKHDVISYCCDEKKTITGYVIDVSGIEYDLLIYYTKTNKKTITLANKKKDEFILYR